MESRGISKASKSTNPVIVMVFNSIQRRNGLDTIIIVN